jgi:hypothetical protein
MDINLARVYELIIRLDTPITVATAERHLCAADSH